MLSLNALTDVIVALANEL